MKTYLAIFTGTAAAMEAFGKLPPTEIARKQAEGSKAWHAWAEKHQASIVAMGGPLGKTKRISHIGIEDVRNNMGAYTVVQAESHEAAAKLFEGHPHFTIFPGDGIEVMEVLPIPGQ
jgi:hypothetical protein